MSVADFNIDKFVFEPIEEVSKTNLWYECRDFITNSFVKDFKSNVEFGQMLYEVAKPSSPEKIKSSTMASSFIKIAKMKQTLDDPIRAITKINNLLITISGELLLDADMFAEFFGLLNDWVCQLYVCENGNCSVQCKCKVNFFNYAIKCNGIDARELFKSKDPGRVLFEKLCGTMINSVHTLLKEIDTFIPNYMILEKYNCEGLRKLLVDFKIPFQIIYQNERLWIHVANDHDRCGANAFIKKYLPSSVNCLNS